MHDQGLLTVLGVFIANVAMILPLFLWIRTESRNDYRHLDAKMDTNQKQILSLIESIQQEMKDFHIKLALQDKEFKMRLCSIEERNKK